MSDTTHPSVLLKVYFLVFGFIETYAWPVRRVFELYEEDRKQAF